MTLCSYPTSSPSWAVFCVSDIGCFNWYKLWNLQPTCVSLSKIICLDPHFIGLFVFFISSFFFLELIVFGILNFIGCVVGKILFPFSSLPFCQIKISFVIQNLFSCLRYQFFTVVLTVCSISVPFRVFFYVNEFKAIPRFLFYQIQCIWIPDFVNMKKISS